MAVRPDEGVIRCFCRLEILNGVAPLPQFFAAKLPCETTSQPQKIEGEGATWRCPANPFSMVVLAHLAARATRDGESRKESKLRLIRLMYERGYAKVDILELFRVIDWILRLPVALEQTFLKELHAYEKAKQMSYITSVEHIGIQKGIEQGIERGIQQGDATPLLRLIELKFGETSEDVIRRIREADADTLLRWSDRILTADTLDALLK